MTTPKISALPEFAAIERMIDFLRTAPNVQQPADWALRRTAEQFALITQFGNLAVTSSARNRSAKVTTYVGSADVRQTNPNPAQQEILKSLPKTLADMESYIRKAPFLRVDRTMGDNREFSPDCTLFVSVQRPEMVRLAYMTWATLFPPRTQQQKVGPAQTMIYIPEWPDTDRQMLVFPEISATVALGTDYYGESKKGFLRLAMWNAKQRGMLGLHAGSKILRVKDTQGKPRRYGMLIFGMSGTGKTTHTCHLHGLTGEGEGIEILQDDVVMLRKDGAALGTERGFYLKTEGLEPVSQPIIYKAAVSRNAIFENVTLDYEGKLYFEDEVLTSNGRGIMMREELAPYISDRIDLPPAAELDGLIVAFITRRHTVVPLAAKLTPEQAAACFMLGETIETSAGDPKRAGESIREVGTNPFIIGDFATEGNWFYEFVKGLEGRVQCYQLNTGGLGEIVEKQPDGAKVFKRKVQRVEIVEMASIIRGIAEGTIDWGKDAYWNITVPLAVKGFDIKKYSPEKFYDRSDIERQVAELRKERAAYMDRFPKLDPAIIRAAAEM